MPSKALFLPLWVFAAALIGLPEETNQSLHTHAASIVATLLTAHQGSSSQMKTNEALVSWAEEREEELHTAETEAGAVLERKYPFCVANVIFQSNTPWSNTVWIDVGRKSSGLSFPIQKNCPVVVRDSLVGIVDFVGKESSRVRLLSDPSVHPGVRVVRDTGQMRHLIASAHDIQQAVSLNSTLLPKPELASTLSRLLDCLLQSLPKGAEQRLAKGELQGAEYPSSPSILRGVGFNYDSDDEEGPKRDLRTGQRSVDDQKILLIKPGDLLETSGLDGIFPKGLRVANVTTVSPLEEGAISYRILARIDALDFPNFDHLTIIPAQPQDPLHPPTATDLIKGLIEESSP